MAGSYTDPATGTFVDTATSADPGGTITGSATYLLGPGGRSLTAQDASGSGAVAPGADGSGYIGFEGMGSGTAGVVAFEGAGGGIAG